MNAIWLAIAVLALYLFGWLWYSRFLAERIYCLDPKFPTPAHRYRDGVDFVPTNKWVLWGHHFTSVAGAAPIVGPAIAMYWGWGPAIAWVALGTVFAAGVHDFGALVLSIRHRGQSIGTMASRIVGRRAKLLFLFIILILILMVNAVFAWVIANLFINNPGAVLPVVLQVPVAIWIGTTVLRRGGRLLVPSLVALVIMYGTAILTSNVEWLQIDLVRWLGGEGATTPILGLEATPASFLIWILVLLGYVYIASTLPVWKLLQPRDYINAQQLLVGLGILYLGLVVTLPEVTAPVIAGAANNQLERPEHGRRLHERGILYAPDYVINAGGVIEVAAQWGVYDAGEVRRLQRPLPSTLENGDVVEILRDGQLHSRGQGDRVVGQLRQLLGRPLYQLSKLLLFSR